ncbi:MAG: bifunctional ornithine acetyltransferase/N-acetylglutamate synthase [Pseudomonadota bacterium]
MSEFLGVLYYFISDAKIESNKLHHILTNAVNKSFNRISVDTDTSTSDTVVSLCNGLAGQVDINAFEEILTEMAVFLAKEIARDGEGATKLIELIVSGAQTKEQALLTAKSVINSPLVKTAIYGSDPNWGRFVMAIGKVFQYSVDISELKIYFGKGSNRLGIDLQMFDQNRVPLKEISELLSNKEVYIEIVLGKGAYSEKVWGCDLTEEYIKINAHYTT